MKQMLIVQPHWPPSNLVGVHRVRLIANELHTLGWKAVVLVVDERDYEEELVPETTRLVAPEVEVIKVRVPEAPNLMGKRLYGDIALRGWNPLKKEALNILQKREIHFIWFSLPPWYIALLGPILNKRTGVPYGVDYRDPWIYQLAPHEKGINRAFFTLMAARVLEPLALRSVSLVTGVSDGYVQGVRDRYRRMDHVPFLTFQMGFARRDHVIDVDFTVPFTPGKRTYVYAGAHWSMGAPLFTLWLKALAQLHKASPIADVEFLFIGTGRPDLPSIRGQIEALGISDIAREIPERLSYLSVQKILRQSHGAMVIGSVEPHYSASKIFQCLVTAPRLFAFFHEESEGRSVLEQCQADPFYVPFRADTEETTMLGELARKIADFANPEQPWEANLDPLEEYTTNRNARHFLSAVEQVIAPHVMTHRLAILSTHPIQYNAPLFRMLHNEDELVVQVFFSKTWDQVKYDPDFGQEVVWDIAVSEGYPHSTHNASSKAGKEELCTAIRAFKADALLVYGWNFPGHFAVMRKLHGTLPIWFRGDSHLLNPMPIWKKAIRKAMLNWVYRHVDVAFTVGTANEAYYRWSGLKQSQLIRAPHAVDVDYWASEEAGRSKEAIQWRKELSIPTAARVVGFAGKVEPIKQVDLIIQSTLDSGEHHHVIIAGTGPLEAKFKEQFGQEPRVHFLGFVNQSRMPIFYRMIDLLALASSSETWGLCVNEAMACGTPCIVSDRTGCSLDMFHHADTGAVAPWNDGGAWRQGIATCLTRTAPDLTSSSIHDQFHPQRFVEAIRTEIDRCKKP